MANDIEYSKFLMQIQKMVKESLSEQNINADVYIQKVTKNNNTEFMALVDVYKRQMQGRLCLEESTKRTATG